MSQVEYVFRTLGCWKKMRFLDKIFPLSGQRDIRMRPRIGLTGSFGRGNYGDELYVKTYQHWFGRWADLHLLTGLPQPGYLQDFGKARVDLMDAIVLGGGDLLCPYREKIDRDFIHPYYLRRPLHVAGIGVERNRPDINPNTLEAWRKFLKNRNVKSITMRDSDSKIWIDTNVAPNVEVGIAPDLVCALPLPPAIRPDGPPVLGLVTRHIKHPREYKLMGEIAHKLSGQGWRVRHVIGGVGNHGRKDYENSKTLEVPGKETFYSQDLDDISRALGECSLVLSMKLHTTIVSSMYGVPTISMNPVVKARSFMESIGREKYVFAANDGSVFDAIDAGVPDISTDRIRKLRDDASSYLMNLGQRIWDDFRRSNRTRAHHLSDAPSFPGSI
ncbi:polysaccharide pyruvyl transferase family protein [Tropicimonas sp.]|uniref:polysaccharide pyruvyl transferase family protein n=1 Tax=Tropicimonas sp. TaxID=2067044 RepID=UPI003A8732F3